MIKKLVSNISVLMGATLVLTTVLGVPVKAADEVSIFRTFNPVTGEHLYSKDKEEVNSLVLSASWQYEGVAWSGLNNGVNVYRLLNPSTGEHHYTKDENEVNVLVGRGWKNEGAVWVAPASSAYPVYRLFNSRAKTAVGAHHYTSDENERATLIRQGWNDEGVAWYSSTEPKESAPAPTPEINDNQQFVDEVVRLVNVERKGNGRRELVVDPRLTQAANIRAREVSTLFEHVRPDGSDSFTVVDQMGIRYFAVGENIAYNHKTPEAVMKAWMNSPGHRRNILDADYNAMGVGITTVNGSKYIVQIFAKI